MTLQLFRALWLNKKTNCMLNLVILRQSHRSCYKTMNNSKAIPYNYRSNFLSLLVYVFQEFAAHNRKRMFKDVNMTVLIILYQSDSLKTYSSVKMLAEFNYYPNNDKS